MATLIDTSGVVVFEGTATGFGGATNAATVTLTHADILALAAPGTPFPLVAAPGVGRMIWPLAALIVCDTTAGAYTSIDTDALLGLDWDGSFNAYALTTVVDETQNGGVSNVLAAGGKVAALLSGAAVSPPQSASPQFNVAAASAQATSGYENLPLLLTLNNNGGALADGNAANTLTVTVLYAVVAV